MVADAVSHVGALMRAVVTATGTPLVQIRSLCCHISRGLASSLVGTGVSNDSLISTDSRQCRPGTRSGKWCTLSSQNAITSSVEIAWNVNRRWA